MNKVYTTRDSATSFLRKNGIAKNLYVNFIRKVGDKFELEIDDSLLVKQVSDKVEEKLEPVKNVEKKPSLRDDLEKSSTKKEVKEEAPKKEALVKETVSSVARKLIMEGKTNKEVWAVISEQFNLNDSKKHYPSWYRSDLTRAGKLK